MEKIPIVELREVTVSSGDYEILHSISFAAEEGSCAVFMGAAGSGKSALLKAAAGLKVAESGEVLYRGSPLSRMSRREDAEFRHHSGFVFQDAALWANQSLYDNLAFPVRLHEKHWSKSEVERAVRRAVDLVGYDEDLKARPAELSAGERRLVGLARALVLDPELLFMDDPVLNLDEEAADRIFEVIAALKERGRSVIVISSASEFASRFADFLGVLKNGSLLVFGPYSEVLGSKDPALRGITGRLKPRPAATGPASLAEAWVEALASTPLPDEGAGKKGEEMETTLGDIVNAVVDAEEDEPEGDGGRKDGS